MRRGEKRLGRVIGIVIVVTILCSGIVITPFSNAKNFKLVGQAFCSKANRLFELGQDFAYMIEKYTDGKVKIEFHQAGELVPAMEVLEAASKGIIDFGQACPCVAKRKAYAAQLFCDSPAAQSPIEEIIWYYYGGGKKIFEDIFHQKYHIHPLPMIAITTEIWIYSNKKIRSLKDLKGLKMRAAGMRGEVLKKLGGSVVVLSGSEMVPAMQRGVIDAMEYSSLNCTYPLGFCDVTKYLYLHPRKSTSPMNFWGVNLDKWNSLPKDVQKAIERASKDAYLRSLAWGMMEDLITLKKAVEEKGNKVMFLPRDVAEAFDKAAIEYYIEKAKEDKWVAKILRSWEEFKKNYGKYAYFLDYDNLTSKELAPDTWNDPKLDQKILKVVK